MTENGYSSTPGNTNQESRILNIKSKNSKKKISKKRHFQLTLNCEDSDNIEDCKNKLLNKYNDLKEYLLSLQYNYFISCLEINKRGYYHIHIYIQFETPRSLSIKKCQGAHIEFCRGTAEENYEYILKDGDVLDEFGKMRNYRGGSTIRDVMLSSEPDELLDYDIKYIKCINEVKTKSIDWIQPLYNTNKKLYIGLSHAPNNASVFSREHPILNSNIVFIINNGDDAIFLSDNILCKLNTKYKTIYPADIRNIFIVFDKNLRIPFYMINDDDEDENTNYDDKETIHNYYINFIMNHSEITILKFDENNNNK